MALEPLHQPVRVDDGGGDLGEQVGVGLDLGVEVAGEVGEVGQRAVEVEGQHGEVGVRAGQRAVGGPHEATGLGQGRVGVGEGRAGFGQRGADGGEGLLGGHIQVGRQQPRAERAGGVGQVGGDAVDVRADGVKTGDEEVCVADDGLQLGDARVEVREREGGGGQQRGDLVGEVEDVWQRGLGLGHQLLGALGKGG